ncbi:MAG: hemolysin family protein [Pseudomonadales bacterium]
MGLLLFYASLAIFFSFICSILEAVLLSATPTFINMKKQAGHAFADDLEALKNDVDQPLIAILTLNTVAHTVGAILVGVQAKAAYAEVYGSGTHTLFNMSLSEDMMVGIVSAIMTILVLVLSEIIPKTIGATYWQQLAGVATRALNILVFIFTWTGVIWTLRWFTHLFGKNVPHSVLSREDFHAMTQIAEEQGVFEESESQVIKNMLVFKDVCAKDVMTPRTVMKVADECSTVEEFFNENPNLRFSRIPVYQGDRENIIGLVLKDDVLKELANDNNSCTLAQLKRNILVTLRATPIPRLLDELVKNKNHMALVVDEYGTISGLVTMEDVIETLLGIEIMDESDNVEDLQMLARKGWERRARRLGIINETDDAGIDVIVDKSI